MVGLQTYNTRVSRGIIHKGRDFNISGITVKLRQNVVAVADAFGYTGAGTHYIVYLHQCARLMPRIKDRLERHAHRTCSLQDRAQCLASNEYALEFTYSSSRAKGGCRFVLNNGVKSGKTHVRSSRRRS